MNTDATNKVEQESDESFGKDMRIMCALTKLGESCGMGKGEWNRLAHERFLLAEVSEVLAGRSHIIHDSHVVPSIGTPDSILGFAVSSFNQLGNYRWDPKYIDLVSSGSPPLDGYQPADYSLYSFLTKNPHIIPRNYRKKVLIFPGVKLRMVGRETSPAIYVREKGDITETYASVNLKDQRLACYDVYVGWK